MRQNMEKKKPRNMTPTLHHKKKLIWDESQT